MTAGTLQRMQEFTSLKVTAAEHADLATQLTTMSTQGWDVVNIVSTGTDLIAYLAKTRPGAKVSTAEGASASTAESAAGWASTSSPATTASIPADWYKDPSGRFEYRYWDGAKWTDNVSRAGVTYKDPPIP